MMLRKQPSTIEEPINPLNMTLQSLNAAFDFDWNNHLTIEPNKNKIRDVESLLEKIQASIDQLSPKDQHAFAQLSYKLATFYLHIKRDRPNAALEKLSFASRFLSDYELGWLNSHLALTFYQKMLLNKNETNSTHANINANFATQNCEQLITQYGERKELEAVKITAFAFCVLALTQQKLNQLESAIKNYQYAINLYELHENDGLLDNQYARAKNRLLKFRLLNNEKTTARKGFEELINYWSEKDDQFNPYAARFYVDYAGYLEIHQPEKLSDITHYYQKAATILQITNQGSALAQEINDKFETHQKTLSEQILKMILITITNETKKLPTSKAKTDVMENIYRHLQQSSPEITLARKSAPEAKKSMPTMPKPKHIVTEEDKPDVLPSQPTHKLSFTGSTLGQFKPAPKIQPSNPTVVIKPASKMN